MNSDAPMNSQQQGFTLVELLLAMLIFALIGLASAFVLNQMLVSDERSYERREQLQQTQYALLMLERDVRQMVARPLRAQPSEARNIYVLSGSRMTDSDTDGLGFVRAGWSNPGAMLPRSMLQPVLYRVRDNVLQRVSSDFVDDVSGQPHVQDLLTGVEDFRVRFIHQGEELFEWNVRDALPEVVIVTLVTEEYGEIERWLLTSGEGAL